MPKDSEKPQGKGTKKDKPNKKKKILLILLIVLVVLAGSAAGWYFFFKSPAGDSAVVKKASSVEETKAPARAKEIQNEKLDLGEVVVNLSGDGGGHYLRVKVVMEYPKDNKDLAKELKEKQHQIMDTLISTLRTKTLTDVTAAGSVENIKKSLLTEINNNLITGDIAGIFFTDFLVQ